MKKFAFPLVLIALAGGLVGLFILGGGRGEPQDQATQVEKIGQEVPVAPDVSHVEEGTDITYSTNPPTSGQHWPRADEAGIKNGEMPDERAVHNLEHGYVWITYRPCGGDVSQNCLNEDQVKELKRIAADLPPDSLTNTQKMILSPRSANERAISLVAWGYLLHTDAPDAGVIRQFYEGHVNNGPEKVP